MNDAGSIFKDFCAQCNMAEGTISSALPSRNQLFHFLIVVLSGCFFLDFGLVVGRFWGRKSIKNQSKIYSKIDQISDAILN